MKRTIVLMAATAALLAGCALGETQPGGGGEANPENAASGLKGKSFKVGGKEFTEQLLLCELTAQTLEANGAKADRSCGMSGTNSVRSALTSGAIDMYWEYTGTGWLTHLKQTEVVNDPQALYAKVKEQDKAKNGVDWLSPAPANNTYAVALANETATKLGAKTLSDYAKVAGSTPDQASFCGAAEFFSRDDGWPGLQKAYGFTVPKSKVSELAAGAIYNGINKGHPCVFGEVFATDGRIAALGLTVLEDDKKFFPVYNPALSVKADVLTANPDLEKAFAPVSQALDDATLQKLNAQIDVEGLTPDQVAKDWMKEKGLIK